MGVVHIIDDDCLYRKVIVEVVRAFGFVTKEFSSGSSYLNYMEQDRFKHPQVIFSDMNMPGLSGLATLQEVFCRYPDIPCYLVTGNPSQFENMNLSGHAIREILKKPVCIGKIGAILQSL